ncbi:hypothetical protein ACNQKP_15635 [Bdellovibrio bacteriovorus]|uniref:hypothetical protein n=1 Tax=Bdellovibrio bacteriovorus TaxID=959 RepID=UPI003AA9A217
MRILLFVLILISGFAAHSARPISGTVERDASGVYLRADSSCVRYLIDTKSTDADISVRKLSTGDTLTASGVLDSSTCTAVIESVDYVGLRKMLGYWHSADGLITVRDFNSLSFYPITLNDFQNGQSYSEVDPIVYRYSMTPSDGKDWVLFLSDSTSTTFATIRFNKSRATMKIYDSDTGNVTRTLYLNKWGNLK